MSPGVPRLRTLLLAQAAFMVGFSAVVPYLAVVAHDRWDMDAAAVGVVVGARVAAQQGMFLVGGALADRYGARRLVVAGCGLRAAGLLTVGLAPDPATFLVGVVVVGAAGALFSPALEALVGTVDARGTHRRGPAPFAALAMVGEAGGAVGAVVGGALIPHATVLATSVSAGVFLVALVVLGRVLPGPAPTPTTDRAPRTPGPGPDAEPVAAPGVGALLAVVVPAGVLLATYTQLATLVPLAVVARAGDPALVGRLVALLSVLTLTLQWPVSRVAARLGVRRAVPGALVLAAAAGVVGAVAERATAPGAHAAALAGTTALVALAQMLGGPAAQRCLATAGPPARRATRLGALATAGGLGSLGLSALTGAVADAHGLPAAWSCAAATAAVAAVAAHRALPRLAGPRPAGTPAPPVTHPLAVTASPEGTR
ncbi:MFS transporter [Cellulomonas sp. SLBN-39]|uniref:MFS transporter n=1 Tax=Cellulomonas sp. SLBN-39 TaxID=2768446 RepID=UPI00115487C6|nr:MFS transporter [Cellulomonas sp. SLBN-39]TQL03560.1 MFS transporter [Cellulomonas sp. SLBN-39]